MDHKPEGTSAPLPSPAAVSTPVPERRSGQDRRQTVVDRRTTAGTSASGSAGTGLERRRGPGRRRSDFMKSAEEGQMSHEQFLFVMAIDAYKRVNQKPFPTWTEVLEVIRKLGYRKTCGSTLSLPNCEDWTEAPDAPAFTKPVPAPDAGNNTARA